MRSKFEDTRRKALKYGAQGATVKAFRGPPDGVLGVQLDALVRDESSIRAGE
jgi:hypothetical protein